MRGNIYSKASRITLRHSPFPVAAMRYHLIRLTPFGTFPSRGRLCLLAISQSSLNNVTLTMNCLPFFFLLKAWYNGNQQTTKSALLAARRMT